MIRTTIGIQMPSSRQLRALSRLLLAGALLLAARAYAVPAQLPAARAALLEGRVGEASTLLQQVLAADPNDGAAHLLLCRVDFALFLIDPAVGECRAAVAAMPNDSNAQMWLGRALGLKAEHGSKLSALPTALQVRDAFERAVALDPSNADAAKRSCRVLHRRTRHHRRRQG